MKKTEYRAALKKLGLGVIEAGDLFGFAKRQSQRFVSGDAPIPALVGKVIELLLAGKITVEDLK